MKLVLLLLCLVHWGQCVSLFTLVGDEWELFKAEHGKEYKSDLEEKFRRKIFLENRYKIAKHNLQYEQGLHSYKLGMNKYGDMLHQEFVKVMNGYMGRLNDSKRQVVGAAFIGPDEDVQLPESMDWRKKGAVTQVKDQGQCGSCWSFSTTGSLEGQHFRKTGKLVSLSEQNLIDCSVKFGNNGCNGGLMDYAFAYVRANGGIDTEAYYPYEAEEEKCRYNPDPQDIGATDTGFVDVESGSESSLKKAVATVGPVSVAIDASHESFQFYKHGVYYEEECSPRNLDHGVLAVGYGTSESGQDYWIVKNSWSPSWGDEGYIKMARNRENNCGIASSASYPLV